MRERQSVGGLMHLIHLRGRFQTSLPICDRLVLTGNICSQVQPHFAGVSVGSISARGVHSLYNIKLWGVSYLANKRAIDVAYYLNRVIAAIFIGPHSMPKLLHGSRTWLATRHSRFSLQPSSEANESDEASTSDFTPADERSHIK